MTKQNQEINELARKQIGQYIKKLIDSRGISPAELAHRAGISVQVAYNTLAGKNYNMKSFIDVCQALKIQIDLKDVERINFVFTKPELRI